MIDLQSTATRQERNRCTTKISAQVEEEESIILPPLLGFGVIIKFLNQSISLWSLANLVVCLHLARKPHLLEIVPCTDGILAVDGIGTELTRFDILVTPFAAMSL